MSTPVGGAPLPSTAVCRSLALEYASLRIRVASEAPAPLVWLREFLRPAFGPAAAAARSERAVEIRLDPVAYADAVRSRPGAAAEIDCFTLDSRFARWPAWAAPDGRRLVHDHQAEAIYQTPAPGGPSITILAAEDAVGLRRGLLRVVRELATAHALRAGCLHLHAAAVEHQGGVVAFAGPRHSGKTTLLLHALTRGGARFVSGDRVLVDASLTARGMPTIVSLRDGSLDYFPSLRARLAARGCLWFRTMAESAARAAAGRLPRLERRGDGRPRGISAAQLCAAAEADAVGHGPLALLAFPRVAAGVPSHALRVLTAEEAAARLRASLFLPGVPERSAAAFDGEPGPFTRDAAALDALARELTRRVRCVDLGLGPAAYGDSRGLHRTTWAALRELMG